MHRRVSPSSAERAMPGIAAVPTRARPTASATAAGGTLDASRGPAPHAAALTNVRVGVTLLVVAHHAALAYHPHAPPLASALGGPAPTWPAFPIVDVARWAGAATLVGVNDVFFMALLFLVSGAVAAPSLLRRGGARHARDRLLRLGVPFVLFATVLAPLAYSATHVAIVRARGAHPSAVGFADEWLRLGWWPAGPGWFLWVLLAFGLAAAALTRWRPHALPRLGERTGRLARRPLAYGAALAAASAAGYVPVAALAGAEHWTTVGPFAVQSARVPLYAVHFVAGLGLGAFGLREGLLAERGALARGWPWWVAGAGVAFAAHGAVASRLLRHVAFPIACAAAVLAALAFAVRWSRTDVGPGHSATRATRWADAARRSLAANAYAIYLLHYPAVTWAQLAVQPLRLGGGAKALLVWSGAVATSWALAAALRRAPGVTRVL